MLLHQNRNPLGNNTGDCVVRAMASAEDMSWYEAFDALCAIARKLCLMPNSRDTFELFLRERGWVKQKMPKENGKRIKMSRFVEMNKDKRMVCKVVKHIVYAERGNIVDIWDCSNLCVGNYWTK